MARHRNGQFTKKDLAVKTDKIFQENSNKKSDPVVIAELIKKGIEVKNPKIRYSGGYRSSTILLLKRFLPDKIMDKMIMSYFK